MARLPDELIARIKSEVSLVALVEHSGVVLKKQGKDYLGRCPFHADKTPSLVVSPATNLWHCLGACGVGGSVIDYAMRWQGLSFRAAVDYLQAQALPVVSLAATAAPVADAPPPLPEEALQALLGRVVDYYHQQLLASPVARAYLAERGLDNEALITRHRLGFCDTRASLGAVLASRGSAEGQAERRALQTLGITLQSGLPRFAGSLVIPIINAGQVLELYGRKINDSGLRKGTAKHLYLPGPHRGVWDQDALLAGERRALILCESLIDALSCQAHGFADVTCSYGVHGFTGELQALVTSPAIERVWIAYDADEAGDKAAAALAEKLSSLGVACGRLRPPATLDMNASALASDDFAAELGASLEAAVAPPECSQSSLAAPAANPASTLVVQQHGSDDVIVLGERHYRVRGLNNNRHGEALKINLMVRRGDLFFIDVLDMYQAKQRGQFIKQAAVECALDEGVLKADVGRLLLRLEALQDERQQQGKDTEVVLDAEQRDAALALLKAPNLMARIAEDFRTCGLVGERTNSLVGYLACVSRKLDKPLAVIIQSSSAAGKSSLMEAMLAFMPPEEREQYSAMTGQSLYYLGETSLKHKILAISEEEGAEHASYALKLLQSEGRITIASTGKNAASGNLETQTYQVEGPVMLLMTTTAIDIDEELLNRCLVLSVNESREQTEAIHRLQRQAETLEGLRAKQQHHQLIALHQNAQRLLRPVKVVNPFARELTFLSHQTRTRRDHMKYLSLIRTIAFLHQYQRPVKQLDGMDYIEVTPDDIALANELAHDVLGRTLDELPPQTRKLLTLIHDWVQAQCAQRHLSQSDVRFSRRDIRAATGWSDGQLKIHCARLEDMEYLLVHSGGRGKLMAYELLYDGGPDHQPHLMGLIRLEPAGPKPQVSRQTSGPGDAKSGQTEAKSEPGQPQVRPKSGPGQGSNNGTEPKHGGAFTPMNAASAIPGTSGPKQPPPAAG